MYYFIRLTRLSKKKKMNMNHKEDEIISQIYLLRGKKVIIDSDLTRIYGVTTRRLNEQVRRNIDRFPRDFMFKLSKADYLNLMSQIATSRLKSIENIDKYQHTQAFRFHLLLILVKKRNHSM